MPPNECDHATARQHAEQLTGVGIPSYKETWEHNFARCYLERDEQHDHLADACCDFETEVASLRTQLAEAREIAEAAHAKLSGAICQRKGCMRQAECFGVLNEGTYTRLLAGCSAHMTQIVRSGDVFAHRESGAQIVESTRLGRLPWKSGGE